MDTAALLSSLRERDVKLWVEGDQIRCTAPVGALDAEMRAILASRKVEILAFLQAAEALKSTPTTIVPIKPGGRRPPLFIVSAYRADVFFMLPLARQLDAEQPVLGIGPPDLDDGELLSPVEALAHFYVEQIRRYWPNGPYLIGGHCSGGTIAFEVAQQLTEAGEKVALLALIGSPFPTAFGRLCQLTARLTSGSLAERKQKVKRRLHKLTHLPQRIPGPEAFPEASLTKRFDELVGGATLAAIRAYRPKRYDGQIDQFVSGETWHHADLWQNVAGTLCQYRLGSLFIEDILRGPEVVGLAAALQKRLDIVAS